MEAAVVGVEDEEYGERVGALVTLSRNQTSLDIHDLRGDLRRGLPAYKLPTLLKVVQGELPKGPTGKVQKKVLGPQYFPVPGWQNDPELQVWNRQARSTKAKI